MSQDGFAQLMGSITARIGGRPLDAALEAELNRALPADGSVVRSVVEACRDGIAAGGCAAVSMRASSTGAS